MALIGEGKTSETMSDSTGTNNKRQRVDEEEGEGAETVEADIVPRQFVKLPEEMRTVMGGRKYVAQEELTREVLLQYLKGREKSEKWQGWWKSPCRG